MSISIYIHRGGRWTDMKTMLRARVQCITTVPTMNNGLWVCWRDEASAYLIRVATLCHMMHACWFLEPPAGICKRVPTGNSLTQYLQDIDGNNTLTVATRLACNECYRHSLLEYMYIKVGINTNGLNFLLYEHAHPVLALLLPMRIF